MARKPLFLRKHRAGVNAASFADGIQDADCRLVEARQIAVIETEQTASERERVVDLRFHRVAASRGGQVEFANALALQRDGAFRNALRHYVLGYRICAVD